MANNSDIQRIKEWFSEKTDDHEGAFIISTYLILFVIGVLFITLTPGKKPFFESALLAILWPIEFACAVVFLTSFVYFIYKVICFIIKR